MCFFFTLVPFPFSFSKGEGGVVIRRTRSGNISSSYVTSSSSLLNERGNDYEVSERQSRKSENGF